MTRRGFTLIELLVVVAIIGILARIAIPGYQQVRTKARAASVVADLRTIRGAVYEAYGKTAAWPASAGVGVIPSEIRSLLPGGLSFTRADGMQYDWHVSGMTTVAASADAGAWRPATSLVALVAYVPQGKSNNNPGRGRGRGRGNTDTTSADTTSTTDPSTGGDDTGGDTTGNDPTVPSSSAVMGMGIVTSDEALKTAVLRLLGDNPTLVTANGVYWLIWGPGVRP
jgi:prepilin-type N-terminal cleavage/methylation domain-containing protein